MSSARKGYLNLELGQLLNLIIAIIFPLSYFLGPITRFLRGHIIAGILQLIPPLSFVFWVLDILGIITVKDLSFCA